MSPEPRRALVLGLGLIGGSVALGLRGAGFQVFGRDQNEERAAFALAEGLVDDLDDGLEASGPLDLILLAVPVDVVPALADQVVALLEANPTAVATDVAGVKAPVLAAIAHPRFIGGHPMAGAELVGPQGARADLFVGSTWVLCPEAETDPEAFAKLHGLVLELGASPVALAASVHDRLVATVSHLPHLVAASLMNQAAQLAEADPVLLRLAAGGFRDMTRVASGDPRIWPDLLISNREAILEGIEALRASLAALAEDLRAADREDLGSRLAAAQQARRALPAGRAVPQHLSELRIPVPDRAGVLAEVTTAASASNVNLLDIEIAHSAESAGGVLVLVVERGDAQRLAEQLGELGYRSSAVELEG